MIEKKYDNMKKANTLEISTTLLNLKFPFMYSKKRNCVASVPSVRNLYIPRIGPHIFLQQNRQTWNIFAENPLAELTGLPE